MLSFLRIASMAVSTAPNMLKILRIASMAIAASALVQRRQRSTALHSKKPPPAERPVYKNGDEDWVGRRRRRIKDDVDEALQRDWQLGSDSTARATDARGWLDGDGDGGAARDAFEDDVDDDGGDYFDEPEEDEDYEDELEAEMRASR